MKRLLYLVVTGLMCSVGAAFSSTRTVTTVDNGSTEADGETSLLEALRSVQPGDTITFRIPGSGPHYILTPIGGYPLLRADGVTLDGYTQPGARPNSAPFDGTNNADIRIVLDSRGEEQAGSPFPERPGLILRRSTRMVYEDGTDIPGYGDTENAILAVVGARQFRVTGLAFVGRHTHGSVDDPYLLSIALAKGATDAKVQGCAFGWVPGGEGIHAMRSAVAGFRHRTRVSGQDEDLFSGGLVFGTDGDGVNDAAEGNTTLGMVIALALELPGARISGNRFNVFQDGVTFLDIRAYALGHGLASMECFENGRGRDRTLIGTDGDGVSDTEERNVFAPPYYDHLLEFYGGNPATGCVVAGNFVGVGVDGVTRYPHEPIGGADFLYMNNLGEVRIGSNGDGVSDDLEANVIQGLGGGRFADFGPGVSIVARGNQLTGNRFLGFPFAHGSRGRMYPDYYASVLAGPLQEARDAVPELGDVSDGFLSGALPPFNRENYPFAFVDLYLRDADSAAGGRIAPGRHLGTFVEGSTQDSDPAPDSFRVPVGPYEIPEASELVIAVTYSSRPDRLEPATALTGPLSGPVASETSVPAEIPRPRLKIWAWTGEASLEWDGDEGVFRLESCDAVAGSAWVPVPATVQRMYGRNRVRLTADARQKLYRLVGR